ncbi:hypothetical protein H0H92_002559 [Tricholoma furcatifolium]|nr:hypothetical protein H0H92_002559 [Tricholoma furcatifolium]
MVFSSWGLRPAVLISGRSKPFQRVTSQRFFPGTYRSFRFRTLDPSRVQREDFVDLSLSLEPHVYARLNDGKVASGRVAYHFNGQDKSGGRAEPFPNKTRGYFYCHRDQRLPSTTAEVRFRIAPDDNPTFENGTDLLMPNAAIPWSIPLVMSAVKRLRIFQTIALQEGLIQPDSWITLNVRKRRILLTYLEKPFVIDLQSVWIGVNILTPALDVHVHIIHRLLCNGRDRDREFDGKLLVHFERTSPTTFALRVIQILEPIQRLTRIPQYPIPLAGTLLRGKRGVKEFKCKFLEQLPSLGLSDSKTSQTH